MGLGSLTLPDGGSQQAPESAGQRGGAEEEGESLLGLGALVPHGQEVEAAREHAALEQAQEEARGEDARVVLREPLEDHDRAEADAADGEPDARGELLEEDVGGDLEEDVCFCW